MALKFEIIGNNLVVTDTADSTVKLERPAADVYAICESDKFKLVTRTDRNDILLTKDYTGLVDSANTGFSKDTFTNFCRHSLGALKQGGFTFVDPSLVPVISGPQAARTDIAGVALIANNGDLVDQDGNAIQIRNTNRYKGSLVSKSSMPQAGGTFSKLGGQVNYILMDDVLAGDILEVPHCFAGAPLEAMKGTSGVPANDGSASAVGSIIVDGVAIKCFSATGDLWSATVYGDVAYQYAVAPRDMKAGELFVWKGFAKQVAATTGTNAGQFFQYFTYTRGDTSLPFSGDRYFRFNDAGITDAEMEAFAADPTDTVLLKGTSPGYVGWRPHHIAGLTKKPTWVIAGNSRNQGSPVTNTGAADSGSDMYGGIGEIVRTLMRKFGVVGLGIQTEAFTNVLAAPVPANCYKARRKLAVNGSNHAFCYGINEVGVNATFNNELTCKTAYKALVDGYKSLLLVKPKRFACATIGPNTPSTNFYTDVAGQTPGARLVLNMVNGGMRRGEFGNSDFFETMNAICEYPDSGVLKVAPNARIISTGNGLVRTSGATATAPAIMEYVHDSNIFTIADEGTNFVLEGKGADGDLQGQIQYISPTTIRLHVNGSKGFSFFSIPASRLLSPLAPSNTGANVTQLASFALSGSARLAIGAYYTGGDIHRNYRGEEMIASWNWANGRVPLD